MWWGGLIALGSGGGGINLPGDRKEWQALNWGGGSKHILNFAGMTRLVHLSGCADRSDS